MIQFYIYRPLEHADSIRLLILHPAVDDDTEIRCTIQHVRLSDPDLDHEAISYTWGDVGDENP